VKKNQTSEIARLVAFVVVLTSCGFFGKLPECDAQTRLATAEYDYHSLALTSISNSAREASKLPNIPQRVGLLLSAAKILAPFRRDETMHLLDVAVGDLKQWASEDNASWYQRHRAAGLRNEVLALYVRIDPENATALQKEFQAEVESTATNAGAASLKTDAWFAQFSNRRTTADQAAKIALSTVDTEPDKALTLVVQSLQGGTVSGLLFDIVQKLIQKGDRAFLNKLEMGIGETLAANVTLDPLSLSFSSALLQSDKDMPPEARAAFISFFMGSLQSWSQLLRDASANGGLNSSYINLAFTMFSMNVRPALFQHAPAQVPVFDSVMKQLGPLVPEATRSRLQAFEPEKLSDPRDRLHDILSDANPQKRDLRLVRLTSELLRDDSVDFQKNRETASDAISGFSDPDVKSAFTDLLTITRLDALVKQEKFIEAQELAGSISSEETRAWALLALSTVAAKGDRVLGFELISNALKALDKAPPSPHKVELALIASAMLAKSDPQRAFDTLSTASRYANSSASKVNPPTKPAVAFGLDAAIGDAHTKLGVFPESLAELQLDPSLSLLGTTDWFRSQYLADEFREPALRIRLKLQFASSILAQESKPKSKKASPKPSARN
jgi:hypothetical protein